MATNPDPEPTRQTGGPRPPGESTELRTERLRLRPPDAARDLAQIVSLFSDPDVARFVYRFPSPFTRADAEELFMHAAAGDGGEDRFFVILDGLTGEFLGAVSIELRDGGEVGYGLAPEARGRGIMAEAVRAVVRWAHEGAGIRRLFLTTDPDNTASQRVAERAGFRRTGTVSHDPPLRGGRTASFLYEWQPA